MDDLFGTGGIVVTAIGFSSVAMSLAVQLDGKIVVGGYSYNGSNIDFAVARYNADGMLDGTFGTAGFLTTPIGMGDDFGYAVALQSDEKIILCGSSNIIGNNDFTIVRYDTSGNLDGDFGMDGIVTTPSWGWR